MAAALCPCSHAFSCCALAPRPCSCSGYPSMLVGARCAVCCSSGDPQASTAAGSRVLSFISSRFSVPTLYFLSFFLFDFFLGGAACLCVSLLKMTWDRFVRRAAKRSNKETLPYRTRLDPSGETRETGCVHHAMVNYVVVVVAARAHRGVVTKAAAAATIRGESN